MVGAIPFVVILVCNVTIIITVKSASRERIKMAAVGGRDGNKRKGPEVMTRMLILVSAAYMVTVVPFRVYLLILNIPEVSNIYDMTKGYWIVRFNAQNEFLAFMSMWNYALNYYLYCVGGGRRYRRDTVEIFADMKYCFAKRRN